MGSRAPALARAVSVFAFASVAAMASVVVSKNGGYLWESRFCFSGATKYYQDGPNSVQHPTHRFCEDCYRIHAERRRALYLHFDWESMQVIYGNQTFEGGRLQKSEVQAIDLMIDGR